MAAQCIACGMPMEKPEDHAAGDVTRDYCLHCARPDGTMQSYDEKVESMAAFIMRARSVDRESAREIAKEIMSGLPAWRDRPQH